MGSSRVEFNRKRSRNLRCAVHFYEPNWDQKTLRNYPPACCIVMHFQHGCDTLAGRACNLAVDTRRQSRTFSVIYPYTIRGASWLCGVTYVFCLRAVATRPGALDTMLRKSCQPHCSGRNEIVHKLGFLFSLVSSWSRAVCRATLTIDSLSPHGVDDLNPSSLRKMYTARLALYPGDYPQRGERRLAP